jgi:hypothetical protein
MVKIYCLIDPRTNAPFYVGATVKELRLRLNSHIAEATIWQPNFTGIKAKKQEFIRDIINSGNRPLIKYMLIVNRDKAAFFELCYYNFLTKIGFQLFQDQRRFIYKYNIATNVQK